MNDFSDPAFAILYELIEISEREKRPVFPSLLNEPVFFRKVRKWVLSGMRERLLIEKVKEDTGLLPKAG